MPERFQRSRRKGARLPAGVVVVTRPTKWGNPHPLELGRGEALRRYRDDLAAGRLAVTVEDVKRELRGHDLACYCPLDEPCHADVLLDLANEPLPAPRHVPSELDGEQQMIREIHSGEGALVAAVLHELRPHRSVDEIPALIDAQRAEGYRVVGSFVDDTAAAVAGFRFGTNLALGGAVYVDDLVTLPSARGEGHARALLEWVATEASRLGCAYVHLDSATHRHPAHRLYLRAGYDITSFHFVRSI